MTTKYFDLLDRLVEQTNGGNLKWEETVENRSFMVSFPNYTIRVSQEDGENDMTDYVISIINNEGSVIDRFSDVTLSQMRPGGSYFTMMEELFNNARRNAFGADKALDDILSELSDLSSKR